VPRLAKIVGILVLTGGLSLTARVALFAFEPSSNYPDPSTGRIMKVSRGRGAPANLGPEYVKPWVEDLDIAFGAGCPVLMLLGFLVSGAFRDERKK
jgi:hypothetical protein